MEHSASVLADSIARIHSYVVPRESVVPYKRVPTKKGVGTGFFVPGGQTGRFPLLVTCAHVVKDAHRIGVVLPTTSGEELPARAKLIVPDYDLAIIQIEAPMDAKSKVRTLPVGDSDALQPGEHLFAIGFPLGQEGFKITDGVFSGQEGNNL